MYIIRITKIKTIEKALQSVLTIMLVATLVFAASSAVLSSVSAAPTVGTNINATNNTYTQNEPNIAVNPLDHNKLVVGYNDNHYAPSGGWGLSWSWSDNGGSTWTFGGHFTPLSGYTQMVNPIVAFDNAGNAYYCGVIYNYASSGSRQGYAMDGSIFLAKSNDGGHTFNVFQKTIATGSGFDPDLDRPWMCVNPANNHIYVTWVRRMNAWLKPSGGEIMTIWFARSIDGGLTFSTPVQVGSDLNPTTYPCSHGPQVAIGPGSNVYVSWHTSEIGDDRHDPSWKPPKIWISQSTNDGSTFGSSNLVATKYYSLPAMFISMGTDLSNGRIYIAYAERPTEYGDLDIYVATSTAVAGTWTSKRVNDDPVGNGAGQFWPSLGVAPDGRAELIWYDYRAGSNYINVYYTASTDGGNTWETNTKATSPSPGCTPSSDYYTGDFCGSIASLNDKAEAVWMDNRVGNQEIFFATLTMATAPTTYDVTIDAYCNTEATAVNVAITEDGSPTGLSTPKTFTGLTGTHTFTVPSTDASGHPFKEWSTGSTSTTITVSTGGTFTAHYQAAPPAAPIQWSKTYGGTSDETACSVVQTSDGGYALAGYTDSYGAGLTDFWLVKTDSAGNPSWSKTYGGTGEDGALSVVKTSDGGYALAGYTESYGAGSSDFWLVKTDSAGNPPWSKPYGGTDYETACSVVQTSDGGYALAGYTYSYGAGSSDFWLVKTDSAGNPMILGPYGGGGQDFAHSVVQTSDGGYALAGYTNSYGAGLADFWLFKTNSAGEKLWSKTYGGGDQDLAYSVVQTSDGGYALAGSTKSYGAGNWDFWLVKTDSAGNPSWSKTYGGTGEDGALSVVKTSDGGYALAGYTYSYGAGSSDFWLVKTDASGNLLWSKTYGGTGADFAYSVVQTSEGGYALAGSTASYGAGSSDFWLVKVPADAPPSTVHDYDGLWHTTDFTITLTATDDFTSVFETYYKINDGPLRRVNINGNPIITTEGANNKLEFWSVDSLANEELPHKILTGIKLDKTIPTGSIVINNGDASTSSTSVTLSLTSTDATSGVYQVRYSNDGVWDTETWETPASTKSWTLTSGDGTKTVYYQVKDNAGLTSTTYSDTITLSPAAPTGSIVINNGDAYTTSTSVTLSLTYTDGTSGVYQVRYSNDGVWDTETWETPAATKSWTLTSGDGTKTVYYQIKSNAELVSTTYSDTITLVTTGPTGSIVINGGDASTTSTSVTLTLTFADAVSGVSQVRYSNDGVWDSEAWEAPAATRAWTLTSGDGTKTVYYQIKNNAGLTSITYSDTIILSTPTPPPSVDNTKPTANAGSDQTVNEDTPITFDGSASSDNVGIVSYTWTFTDVTIKTLTGQKPSYTFNTPGVYTITLNVKDAAGNEATDTVAITVLDVTKPEADAGQDQTVNVGATVNFDASASSDNVGAVSYDWNFGDGTTGTGKTTTHTYANAGTYTVTLTVKDATGNSATDTMIVAVPAAEIVEGFPLWTIGVIIAAIAILIVVILLWRRRK